MILQYTYIPFDSVASYAAAVEEDSNAYDFEDDIACVDICCEDIACEDIACDDISCDDIACDDIACDDIACDDIACDDIACDEIACDEYWEWSTISIWEEEDWTVADSILEVISATSAEWSEASIVEMAFSWWAAEALLEADSDLDDVLTAIDVFSCDAVKEDFLASCEETAYPFSSDVSLLVKPILSLDMVLLLTKGDFCASSWLLDKSVAVAAIADSCLFSEELVAEKAWVDDDEDDICWDDEAWNLWEDSTWWEEDEDAMAVLCLLSVEDEEDIICWLDEAATTWEEADAEAAIVAEDDKVPDSTTVPEDSPPPSIKLNMLALSDFASTTWEDLLAEDERLTAAAEELDDDFTIDVDEDASIVDDCWRDVSWLCSMSVA